MIGTIKTFNQKKGFGFILTEQGEYFFHYSHLVMEGFKTIEEGTRVEFELVETERGPQAHNIQRI